jgi:hypothetical protein
MTELQFLIKILTQQKLSSALKDIFIERIGEVEASLSRPAPQIPRPTITGQAPSTQRLLDEMATQTGHAVITGPIAQTTAAAAALESRSLAIKQAASGKPEPGRTSPRKF